MTSSSSSYDFVVVGGGTAGLAVASRLAERTKFSVLVLEAGHDFSDTPEMLTPGLAFANLGLPDRARYFMSTSQPSLNDRTIMYPRGKTLGGTSAINLCLMTRGHVEDYNALETLGNEGVNWENMLKYLKRTETYTVTPEQAKEFGVKVDPEFHGTTGPIQRTPPFWTSNLDPVFFDALESLGVPVNNDPFNGNLHGSWLGNFGIDPTNATRSFSVPGYYNQVKGQKSIHVLDGAHAVRVIFEKDKDGKPVAKGVEYQDEKTQERRQVFAKREVILAAGSFQTPQLLELSGIGDKKILDALEIEVVVDLPGVGNNLQDHYWTSAVAEVAPHFHTRDEINLDPKAALAALETYKKDKTGPHTTGGSTAYAFLTLKELVGEDQVAKFIEIAKRSNGADTKSPTIAIQRKWLETDVPQVELAAIPSFLPSLPSQTPQPGKRYVSFLLGLQHMFARGDVHITSTDPLAPPAINTNALNEDIDVEILVASVKYIRRLLEAPAYKDVSLGERFPGPSVQSDEEIREYVRNAANTIHHPVGTASMLPLKDGGVVDSEYRVHGVDNLRIVDASVMPIHMTGHPQQTLYAYAERAADLLEKAHA